MQHPLSDFADPIQDSTLRQGRRRFLRGVATAAGCVSLAVAARADDKPNQDKANQDKAKAAPAGAHVDPNAGLAGIKALFTGKEPVTWVITGDSITHGALHTLGWRSYPEHFAERVRWEMSRVRDVVINTGISGDRTGGILADLDWRVLRFQPQVVSLMFGMNDCNSGSAGRDTFRDNYKRLVDRVMAGGAIPLLNTPNTIYLKNAPGRGDLAAYTEIIRQLADERKLALVDHYKDWQAKKPNQEDLLPWLEDKSIHPGVLGHREFAQEIFRQLGIFDPKSPTCKLEV